MLFQKKCTRNQILLDNSNFSLNLRYKSPSCPELTIRESTLRPIYMYIPTYKSARQIETTQFLITARTFVLMFGIGTPEANNFFQLYLHFCHTCSYVSFVVKGTTIARLGGHNLCVGKRRPLRRKTT